MALNRAAVELIVKASIRRPIATGIDLTFTPFMRVHARLKLASIRFKFVKVLIGPRCMACGLECLHQGRVDGLHVEDLVIGTKLAVNSALRPVYSPVGDTPSCHRCRFSVSPSKRIALPSSLKPVRLGGLAKAIRRYTLRAAAACF
jgi:hypothetical protein